MSWTCLRSARKKSIFLTDLQAASWRPPAGAAEGLKRVLARIEAREPRSVLIDLGKSGGENRAVTDLKLDVPVVTVGSSVLIRAVVRNFGSNPADGVRAGRRSTTGSGPRSRSICRPAKTSRWSSASSSRTPGDHRGRGLDRR